MIPLEVHASTVVNHVIAPCQMRLARRFIWSQPLPAKTTTNLSLVTTGHNLDYCCKMDLVEYGLQSVVGIDCNECLGLSGDSDAPVVIMGKLFDVDEEELSLRSRLKSLLWFSYRRNFPPIGDSELSSDSGFGCMMRCGQMVLANVLIRLKLGDEWTDTDNVEYKEILASFLDSPKAAFGIHQICLNADKPIGQWMGPNTVAHVLKRLVQHSVTNSLIVHVAMDTAIRRSVILEECLSPTSRTWHPLLLFVPLRLGLGEVNPIYFADLKNCLEMPQSQGIIGGRPNHALYFVGFQDDELVFLDPHVTQEAVVSLENIDKPDEEGRKFDSSFHTESFGTLHMRFLDPSLALAFFCRTQGDFEDLCERLHAKIVQGHNNPMLEVCRHEQSQMKTEVVNGACRGDDSDDDDFEIL